MISKIVKGMGYLEGYGDHPGWPIVLGMSAIGFGFGFIVGLIHMFVWFAMFAIGSYCRYIDWEKYSATKKPLS